MQSVSYLIHWKKLQLSSVLTIHRYGILLVTQSCWFGRCLQKKVSVYISFRFFIFIFIWIHKSKEKNSKNILVPEMAILGPKYARLAFKIMWKQVHFNVLISTINSLPAGRLRYLTFFDQFLYINLVSFIRSSYNFIKLGFYPLQWS